MQVNTKYINSTRETSSGEVYVHFEQLCRISEVGGCASGGVLYLAFILTGMTRIQQVTVIVMLTGMSR